MFSRLCPAPFAPFSRKENRYPTLSDEKGASDRPLFYLSFASRAVNTFVPFAFKKSTDPQLNRK
jgi:hypothetical protein